MAKANKKKDKDIFYLPSIVLLGIGLYDIVRGVLHTFFLLFSVQFFAGFDLDIVPIDQVFGIGIFGMSNFVTGFVSILISRKAPELSPYVLAIIPFSYALGWVGIRLNWVISEARFSGKYILYIFFTICIITALIFFIQKKRLGIKS